MIGLRMAHEKSDRPTMGLGLFDIENAQTRLGEDLRSRDQR